MNDIYEVHGVVYESTRTIRDKFGLSTVTLARWAGRGLIPPPLRLGRQNYFQRAAIECRISQGE
jgi:DNA-binding transcriptional MerR regulator